MEEKNRQEKSPSDVNDGGVASKEEEGELDKELRKLFRKNSKAVTCTKCGTTWYILKWKRRPAKRLISRYCPKCNPFGITVRER